MRFQALCARALLVLGLCALSGTAWADEAEAPLASQPADEPLARLRLLFTPLEGRPRAPLSPRFVAMREPDLRGTRVLVGWLMPGLRADDQPTLETLRSSLAAKVEGRLPARLAAPEPLTLELALGVLEEVPLLSVTLVSARPGVGKELEKALLDAISSLGAATSPLAALVRRHLTPLARAVVEVHPPNAPFGLPEVARKLGGRARPKLYVAKAGDTLAKVSRHFGVSEKALRETNRLDLHRLNPGQKLVLPR